MRPNQPATETSRGQLKWFYTMLYNSTPLHVAYNDRNANKVNRWTLPCNTFDLQPTMLSLLVSKICPTHSVNSVSPL